MAQVLWVIPGGLSQDGIAAGSNSYCFSVVLDGIAISVKTLASLRKAVAFRSVEPSLRQVRERTHERFVEQMRSRKSCSSQVVKLVPQQPNDEPALAPQVR